MPFPLPGNILKTKLAVPHPDRVERQINVLTGSLKLSKLNVLQTTCSHRNVLGTSLARSWLDSYLHEAFCDSFPFCPCYKIQFLLRIPLKPTVFVEKEHSQLLDPGFRVGSLI